VAAGILNRDVFEEKLIGIILESEVNILKFKHRGAKKAY
jgi:hypothetical protein